MPTPTYVAIAKTVLTGNQATITFDNIPSTYTDLVLLASQRDNAPDSLYGVPLWVTFNNNSSSLYSRTELYGQSTSTASTRSSGNLQLRIGQSFSSGNTTTNTFESWEMYIPNYAGSTNKPVSTTFAIPNNNTYQVDLVNAGLFSSTTAISRIDLALDSAYQFVSGSRFDLYGIKNS